MGGGWRSPADSCLSLWQTLRLAWQEGHYLRREMTRRGEAAIWLVADDRRSGVVEDLKGLATLLRIFGGQTPPPWLDQWHAEGRQLVCFTPNLLALRPINPNGNVHLSYLSLFAVPLAWPCAFVTALFRMLINQPIAALYRRNAWITSLLAASFDVLLSRQVPHQLLMITSNSFVIELLRYLFIGSNQHVCVTEVLHGIPSLEVEAYHQSMIDFDPLLLSGRLTLVPPVPNIQVNSANGNIKISNHIINLKMNAVSIQRDLSSLAEECVQRRIARSGVSAVTLNGAVSVEKSHYLHTVCFALEQAILQHLLLESKRQGISLHLQYSIHPAHIKSGDAEVIREKLAAVNIEVIDDSFQTWLESDLSISIYSGASWDALALGCDVVFGVSPDDQLYSCGMLSSFAHPTHQKSLFEVLSNAISGLSMRSNLDPFDRVSRLNGRTGYKNV